MNLVAVSTGSTSVRLTWDVENFPAATFTVYRATTPVMGAALSSAQPVGSPWFNDYTAAPATTYYYWLKDQNSNIYGPVSATTAAAVVTADAMDEPQLNALYAWAFGVFGGLYPVQWRWQGLNQAAKPKITLNVLIVGQHGDDDLRDANENLAGSRMGSVSVSVSSVPAAKDIALRAICMGNQALPSGAYTLTINSVAFTVTLTSPANLTAVVNALQLLIQDNPNASPPVVTGLNAWTYGTDPNNLNLAIEPIDPLGALAVVGTTNMTASVYTPPKASVIAQRLISSLGSQPVRDALNAAGIGVGQPNQTNDISGLLQTQSELRSQFDFPVFLASNLAVPVTVIDTVTPPSGTLTN